MPNQPEPSGDAAKERLAFAKDLALRAGEALRQGYGHVRSVGFKGAINLITEFDVQAEHILVEAIRRRFPQDSILAEETGDHGEGEMRWLIDPLDGTTNFAHGIPFFSISIAWAWGLDPVLGVVYDPMRNELFHARAGGGAWCNEARLNVSQTPRLKQSLLVTGFPYDIATNPDNNLRHFAAFSLRTQGVRRLGAASLDLAYIAAGRFDAYWEMHLWPWDWAAGLVLVREAHGRVTRTDGGESIFTKPTSLLASNGLIHQEMLDVLAQTEASPSPG